MVIKQTFTVAARKKNEHAKWLKRCAFKGWQLTDISYCGNLLIYTLAQP